MCTTFSLRRTQSSRFDRRKQHMPVHACPCCMPSPPSDTAGCVHSPHHTCSRPGSNSRASVQCSRATQRCTHSGKPRRRISRPTPCGILTAAKKRYGRGTCCSRGRCRLCHMCIYTAQIICTRACKVSYCTGYVYNTQKVLYDTLHARALCCVVVRNEDGWATKGMLLLACCSAAFCDQ